MLRSPLDLTWTFLLFQVVFLQETYISQYLAVKKTSLCKLFQCLMYLITGWFANLSKFRILCNICLLFFSTHQNQFETEKTRKSWPIWYFFLSKKFIINLIRIIPNFDTLANKTMLRYIGHNTSLIPRITLWISKDKKIIVIRIVHLARNYCP